MKNFFLGALFGAIWTVTLIQIAFAQTKPPIKVIAGGQGFAVPSDPYVISIPGVSKVWFVHGKDRIEALMKLSSTVWTRDEWEGALKSCVENGPISHTRKSECEEMYPTNPYNEDRMVDIKFIGVQP